MKRQPRMAVLSALLLALVSLLAFFASGCGSKEEEPAASSGYYSGPMKGKGGPAPGGKPGGKNPGADL